jgi:hypothetical protein
MATLEFRNGAITTTITPSIISTIDNLDALISHNNSTNPPGGFSYASHMAEYKRDIVALRKNYIEIKSWLEKSNKTLDSTLDRMEKDLNAIYVDDIIERGASL